MREMQTTQSVINAGPRFKSAEDFRRVFTDVPCVLIQDPARNCAYYIRPVDLQKHEVTPETWARLDDSTVTFVIPNGDLVDEIPAYLRNPELDPSVLVRFGQGKNAFFLSFEELQTYKIEQPTTSFDDEQISFIIPRGTELIEELPALRRALLQSNTQ
jgi:hypothetical protein